MKEDRIVESWKNVSHSKRRYKKTFDLRRVSDLPELEIGTEVWTKDFKLFGKVFDRDGQSIER